MLSILVSMVASTTATASGGADRLFGLLGRTSVPAVEARLPVFVVNATSTTRAGGARLRFQLARRVGSSWETLGTLEPCIETNVGCDADHLPRPATPKKGPKTLGLYLPRTYLGFLLHFKSIRPGQYRIRPYPYHADSSPAGIGVSSDIGFEVFFSAAATAPTALDTSLRSRFVDPPRLLPAIVSVRGASANLDTLGPLSGEPLVIERLSGQWVEIGTLKTTATTGTSAVITLPPLEAGTYRVGPSTQADYRAIFWVVDDDRVDGLTARFLS